MSEFLRYCHEQDAAFRREDRALTPDQHAAVLAAAAFMVTKGGNPDVIAALEALAVPRATND